MINYLRRLLYMANLQYDVSVSEVASLLGLVILSIRNEDQQMIKLAI